MRLSINATDHAYRVLLRSQNKTSAKSRLPSGVIKEIKSNNTTRREISANDRAYCANYESSVKLLAVENGGICSLGRQGEAILKKRRSGCPKNIKWYLQGALKNRREGYRGLCRDHSHARSRVGCGRSFFNRPSGRSSGRSNSPSSDRTSDLPNDPSATRRAASSRLPHPHTPCPHSLDHGVTDTLDHAML